MADVASRAITLDGLRRGVAFLGSMRGLVVIAGFIATHLMLGGLAVARGAAGEGEAVLAPVEAFVVAHDDHGAAQHGNPRNIGAERDASEHNPLDHSHALGEDDMHQMTSHDGHDTAAEAEAPYVPQLVFKRLLAIASDDVSFGIALLPPVPPPQI